jgi:hypothetical protein
MKSYGKKQKFYKGIPDIFKLLRTYLMMIPFAKNNNIRIEHYIVSTGFAQVIRGLR